VGFALGASFGFLLGVALSQFRLLQRGLLPYVVASQTVPILAVAPIVVVYPRQPPCRRLVLGGRHCELPHLLPGDDQHAPRPTVDRPARSRADAFVRGGSAKRALEIEDSGGAALHLFRAQDLRHGEHCRRDHRRGAFVDPGGPWRLHRQLTYQYYSLNPENLWATNLIAALLGIAFFLVIVIAEAIVVRRAPENVA